MLELADHNTLVEVDNLTNERERVSFGRLLVIEIVRIVDHWVREVLNGRNHENKSENSLTRPSM